MRLKGNLLVILFLLQPILIAGAEEPPPASVEVAVDRSEITIGDQVHYSLTIDYANGVEIEKPEWGAGLQGFQILDFERNEPQKVGDHWRIVDTYTLSTFTPEDYTIPPINIPVKLPSGATQELTTAPIQIKVASILPENEEDLVLKDIKPPEPVYSGVLTGRVAGVIIGLLALAAAIYLFLRWKKRRHTISDIIEEILPEDEIALEAIERLRRSLEKSADEPDQLSCRQFGLALSEIMRAYLEKRFRFSALEMTTDEIIHFFSSANLPDNSSSGAVIREIRQSIGEMLEDLDLLKFAKETRSRASLMNFLDASAMIIQQTRREQASSLEESPDGTESKREVA
ncbi:MAG: hypothetical protein UZ16_OP3001002312 [Candidatus Hinthialibacteria bacterium OLB16]|nr:MAG: hypothetical protein UZ16_OP3001002312 [Candidatus Hinthialibacteria bacterium OLB16]